VIGADKNDCFVECLQAIEEGVFEGLDGDHVGDGAYGHEDECKDLEGTILNEDQDSSDKHSPEQKNCIVALAPFTICPVKMKDFLDFGVGLSQGRLLALVLVD
jgi:hypothetical protein